MFIERNTTGKMYKTILVKKFISIIEVQLGNGMIFYYDNDQKHAAHIVKHWLNENHIERLIWSSFLPRVQSHQTSLR